MGSEASRRVTAIGRLLAPFLVLLGAAWLLVAATVKLTDTGMFGTILDAHDMLPTDQLWWLGKAIPIAEFTLAFMVILCAACGRATYGSVLLAFAFAGLGLYSTLLWVDPPPRPTPCGCGVSNQLVDSWAPIALRNIGFVVLYTGCTFFGRCSAQITSCSAETTAAAPAP